MSCSCGDPNCNGAPDRDDLTNTIKDLGQVILYVYHDGNTEDDPPFMYTIGRTERGEPELLLKQSIDDRADAIMYLMQEVAKRKVIPGDTIQLDGYAGAWIAVEPDLEDLEHIHTERVVQADAYYGRSIDVLELIAIQPSILIDNPLTEALHDQSAQPLH